MFDPSSYLWLIPTLPLLGAVVCAVLALPWSRRSPGLRDLAHWPCILGAAGACVFSFLLLFAVNGGYHGATDYLTWFSAGDVHVDVTLRADALTAMMLVMVTFIGTFIAIYAAGYMHHDPGYPRFFAAVAGFLFFMTGLVLADNFILLYACWEGVGLCSYLLIGFWFSRPSAAAAARKAFLVTRLGDVGLFLGILLLWHWGHYRLDYDHIFDRAGSFPTWVVTTACLLLFMGAAGKSAQFPLHVWLPDAMEGPTPVSALIHAATMVTAGIYLVARCTPLFALAPEAQMVVGGIGGFTAILAALIALTQTDLKRVLAYSTLSQLGYMFLALGCGLSSERLVAFAVIAAMFHLFTHAFFKALLFLAAGSVMHAMGDVIDMRRFSGLRRVLPHTHWTFLCGAAALAGVPLLSGFWSKDEILAVALEAGHAERIGWFYYLLFGVGIVTAALTAFYTFRAYFMTFWGEERIPEEAYMPHGHAAAHADLAHGHAHPHGHTDAEAASHIPQQAHEGHGGPHESPPIMTVPLMVLAVGSLLVGGLLGPTHLFGHFLEHHWMHEGAGFHGLVPEVEHGHNYLLMGVSGLIALGGIAVAYLIYVRNPATADSMARSAPAAYEMSRNKFYIDELYDLLIVQPLTACAHVLRIVDQYLVDGLVDLVGQLPSFLGYMFRPIQNGLVQFYALLMALGMAGFLLSVLMR